MTVFTTVGWQKIFLATLRDIGGVHSVEDFATQASEYVEPVSLTFSGSDVVEFPPSNQGLVALMIMQILKRLPAFKDAPAASALRYHLMMEVARLAYNARDRFLADPDAGVPVEHLLSDSLSDELAARIDPDRRANDLGPVPAPEGANTIYFSVVDEDGMAVSFINSVYSSFGSAIVGEKSGIWLHNRGQGFTLEAGHPNEIAPRKRPMHTLIPAMLFKDGKPSLVFGVMGADFQPMGHVYVLTNMLHHAMDPQAALGFSADFFRWRRTCRRGRRQRGRLQCAARHGPQRCAPRRALGRRPDHPDRPRARRPNRRLRPPQGRLCTGVLSGRVGVTDTRAHADGESTVLLDLCVDFAASAHGL